MKRKRVLAAMLAASTTLAMVPPEQYVFVSFAEAAADEETLDETDGESAASEETSDENVIAKAMLAGQIGKNDQWDYDDAAENGSTVAEIKGDGQYEVIWDIAESNSDSINFLILSIKGIDDEFTSDTYPDLAVNIDDIFIDGEEYSFINNKDAYKLAYYESGGSVRVNLNDSWTGGSDLGIESSVDYQVKVVFTIDGISSDTESPTESPKDEYSQSTVDNIGYRVYKDHAEVYSCNSSAKKADILSEIEGVPVTVINKSAFQYCSYLSEVIIPDSVTNIGSYAFYHCGDLKEVVIPASVAGIDSYAFSGCSKLREVTIMNPECNIYNSTMTIPSNTEVIYGEENSTAQIYAESYGIEFAVIGTKVFGFYENL